MDVFYNSTFDSQPFLEKIHPSGQLVIGRYTYADNVCLRLYHQDERIAVGSFCSIANEVVIMGGAIII